MLGIGDIVMPGLLLCFVLRYDNYKKQANGEAGGPGTPGRMGRVSYFHCTLIGYFVGKNRVEKRERWDGPSCNTGLPNPVPVRATLLSELPSSSD